MKRALCATAQSSPAELNRTAGISRLSRPSLSREMRLQEK